MDLIKFGRYIDIFYAKTCATTEISIWYHVVLATLFLLSYDVVSESVIKPCIKNDNPLVD